MPVIVTNNKCYRSWLGGTTYSAPWVVANRAALGRPGNLVDASDSVFPMYSYDSSGYVIVVIKEGAVFSVERLFRIPNGILPHLIRISKECGVDTLREEI